MWRKNKVSDEPSVDELKEYVDNILDLISTGSDIASKNSFIEKGFGIAIGATVGAIVSMAFNRKSLTTRVSALEEEVQKLKDE